MWSAWPSVFCLALIVCGLEAAEKMQIITGLAGVFLGWRLHDIMRQFGIRIAVKPEGLTVHYLGHFFKRCRKDFAWRDIELVVFSQKIKCIFILNQELLIGDECGETHSYSVKMYEEEDVVFLLRQIDRFGGGALEVEEIRNF